MDRNYSIRFRTAAIWCEYSIGPIDVGTVCIDLDVERTDPMFALCRFVESESHRLWNFNVFCFK